LALAPETRPTTPSSTSEYPPEYGALRRYFGHAVNGLLFLSLLLRPTRRNLYFAFGKIRRLYYIHVRRKHLEGTMLTRRGGACRQCGACCQLGYQCFHFDAERRVCRIYSHRPTICRVFPIDEKDLVERDAVMPKTRCGFTFPDYRPPAAEPGPRGDRTREDGRPRPRSSREPQALG